MIIVFFISMIWLYVVNVVFLEYLNYYVVWRYKLLFMDYDFSCYDYYIFCLFVYIYYIIKMLMFYNVYL